ncbi:MAG: glycosyltransferase family 2 protein [Weeksellaceae bacterium]|nr:glycosyltransferase family 2 protein [Bacteroidota bacterium]MCG2779523.1 glycosyltransferase family 2 protein [Weeksellaceae bacterium]
MPKVSVIIPCYNQSAFLEDCLDSVFNQTFTDWECLLIDDGSTDDTEEILKRWTEKDSRFVYHRKQNEGVTKTRNYGLDIAKGEWIQFLDADDILDPNKLKKSLENENGENIMITNFAMIFGTETREPFCDLSKYEITFENLVSRWDIDFNLPILCVLTKKEIIGNTRFPANLKAKEDWIFWLEIFRKPEAKSKFINEKLAYYRHNPDGASKNFESVLQDNFEANQFVFDNYDNKTKYLVFQRLNTQNLALNRSDLDQKNYIRKLQSTKILNYYLRFRDTFSKIFKM